MKEREWITETVKTKKELAERTYKLMQLDAVVSPDKFCEYWMYYSEKDNRNYIRYYGYGATSISQNKRDWYSFEIAKDYYGEEKWNKTDNGYEFYYYWN